MFLSGIVLACSLNNAIYWARVEEGNRQAQAVLAESRRLAQEYQNLLADIELQDRKFEQQERKYVDFLRANGPRMPRDVAEMLYKGAEDSIKKYNWPPLPPLPPPAKK